METIIIATDFSLSAAHAAAYAAQLSHRLGAKRLVLYHSHQAMPVSSGDLVAQAADYKETCRAELEASKAALQPLISSGTSIETRTDDKTLLKGIEELIAETDAGLLVAGVTGKGRLEKFLMGTNTVDLARKCPIPTLLVPIDAVFGPIERIVFTSDLEKIMETTPLADIRSWVNQLGAKLSILNVSESGKRFNIDSIPQQYALHRLFNELDPEYHYTEERDIAAGIMKFVRDQQAGLVISIPKSHGFFESLFRRNVTDALAHHTDVPLLLLREKA